MEHRGRAKILPKDPEAIFLPSQAAWIGDESLFKAWVKCRQFGGSWTAAYAATERTSLQSAQQDSWVSSRDSIQSKLFLEHCAAWAKILNIAAQDMGEQVIDKDKDITAYVLKFSNGKRIHSMSSNPDAQAGKRGPRLLDEFALHPDPRKLYSIAAPGLTWGGKMEIVSTHRGSHNFFNQLVREIEEGGNPKGISLHRTTLEDALNQGFLFKLQQKFPDNDPRLAMDETEYFNWVRASCADEESFLQEYMCVPADDDSAFLEYDLIASCEYPQETNWQVLENGPLYMGVDIGRKKDLTILWVLEKLGDVFYTRHIECLQNMRKSEQEEILYPWFAIATRVCIDNTGLGIGWTDDAQDKFGKYRVEGVTFTQQTKEKLAYPVRGAMEDRKARIPFDKEVRADLRSVTKQTTSAGNVRFTAERTPDGHADRFWALALALHAGVMPGSSQEPVPVTAGTSKTSQMMRGY